MVSKAAVSKQVSTENKVSERQVGTHGFGSITRVRRLQLHGYKQGCPPSRTDSLVTKVLVTKLVTIESSGIQGVGIQVGIHGNHQAGRTRQLRKRSLQRHTFDISKQAS